MTNSSQIVILIQGFILYLQAVKKFYISIYQGYGLKFHTVSDKTTETYRSSKSPNLISLGTKALNLKSCRSFGQYHANAPMHDVDDRLEGEGKRR